MTIKVYGIANCDSVKKARKLLEAKGIDYTFIDFKKEQPEEKQIKNWLKVFGAEKVINKRGTTWRKLGDKDQALAEGSTSDQISLILKNTSMIKRPIIESKSTKIIGFDKEAIEALK
jgi:Spx/MgsR family transcriptional regulator